MKKPKIKKELLEIFYHIFLSTLAGELVNEGVINYPTLIKLGKRVIREKMKEMAEAEKKTAEIFLNHLEKKVYENNLFTEGSPN